jgi:hypothetical protein
MATVRKMVSFKDSELRQDVLRFLECQSNFSDSIVYLIEKEIMENGIRNLGNFIPQERTKEYWRNYFKQQNKSNNIAAEDNNDESEHDIIIPSEYEDE